MDRTEFLSSLALVASGKAGLPSLAGAAPNIKSERQYVIQDNNQLLKFQFTVSYTSPGAGVLPNFTDIRFPSLLQNTRYQVKRFSTVYYFTTVAGVPTVVNHYSEIQSAPSTPNMLPSSGSNLTVGLPAGASANDLPNRERFYSTMNQADDEKFGVLVNNDVQVNVFPLANNALALNDTVSVFGTFCLEKLKF